MSHITAGYIRVSTEMQVDRDSLAAQEEAIRKFIEDRDLPCEIYKDAGISAKDTKRPAFQSLLSDIKAGKIDSVVVFKLDRITRNLKDLISLKELFEEHDVTFVSLMEHLDTSTPMGRFVFYILGSLAQMEREVTAERVAEVMKARSRWGKWNGGPVPYGFKHAPEEKTLEIEPKEAEVVRKIFELYQQKQSIRGVVHALNSQGLRTRQGEAWAGTTIKRILQNPMYCGALPYNRRVTKGRTSKLRDPREHILVEGVFEPITPKEVFEEVQRSIQTHRAKPHSNTSQYLLTGLVVCAKCGGGMYGVTYPDRRKEGKSYQYYRCNRHLSKGSSECEGNTIDKNLLEGLIVEALKGFSTNPERLLERAKGYQAEYDREIKPLLDQQKQLQQAQRKIDSKLSKLIELYEDSLITKSEFLKRRHDLGQEKTLIEAELQRVNDQLFSSNLANYDVEGTLERLVNLAEVYDELTFDERRELIRAVVSQIRVGQHDIEYKVFAVPGGVVDFNHTGVPADIWGTRSGRARARL